MRPIGRSDPASGCRAMLVQIDAAGESRRLRLGLASTLHPDAGSVPCPVSEGSHLTASAGAQVTTFGADLGLSNNVTFDCSVFTPQANAITTVRVQLSVRNDIVPDQNHIFAFESSASPS